MKGTILNLNPSSFDAEIARARNSLTPFHIGVLDNYDGLYAIINAIRWLLPERCYHLKELRPLYYRMQEHCIIHFDWRRILREGYSVDEVHKLMRLTCDFAAANWNTAITVEEPKTVSHCTELRQQMKAYCGSADFYSSAMVLMTTGSWKYPTVVRGVTDMHLLTFDSFGFTRMPWDMLEKANRLVFQRAVGRKF